MARKERYEQLHVNAKAKSSHWYQVVDVDRHVDRLVVVLQGKYTHTQMQTYKHMHKMYSLGCSKSENKEKEKEEQQR